MEKYLSRTRLFFSFHVQFPGNKAEKENRWEIPGLLRMKLWLGLEKHESEWRKMQTEGEMAVFAETVSFR